MFFLESDFLQGMMDKCEIWRRHANLQGAVEVYPNSALVQANRLLQEYDAISKVV